MPLINVFTGSGRWQAWLVAAFLVAETVSLTSSSLPPVLTVYGGDGKPCILMAATLQLRYPFNSTYPPSVNNDSSNCSELVLDMAANSSLSFAFKANITSWWLAKTSFTHGNVSVFNDTTLFTRKLGQSYQCDSGQSVVLDGTVLTVANWKVQAFNFSSQGSFDSPLHCSLDPGHTINTVPIAVGAALAGLVIVTLVAYLVGRFKRRSVLSITSGGYEPIPS